MVSRSPVSPNPWLHRLTIVQKKVSPDQYEQIEKLRLELIEKKDFVTDLSVLDNWYDQFYRGNGYLYLKEVKDFQRFYEWS